MFLFSLATPEEADKQSSANYLLERLAECVDPWSARLIPGTFADGAPPVATVVFYDASGNAVATIETAFARALV